jgi:hypothetical protein
MEKLITFPADVESILCVVHEGLHYAELEVDVRSEFMRIVVYDGLNRLTAIRFWREPKNSRKTQESPPW